MLGISTLFTLLLISFVSVERSHLSGETQNTSVYIFEKKLISLFLNYNMTLLSVLSNRNNTFHILARHFIARALLSAENFARAQEILRDRGCGAGDGCSVNMTFLKQEGDRLFHNAEMGPADKSPESQLNILTASPSENIMHCNK